jgi:hypothetical protein
MAGRWKPILEHGQCNGEKSTRVEQFLALHAHLELHLAREHLRRRWSRQVESIGGPVLPIDNPEKTAQD